jgi:single-strand DNA-binding protein
MNKISTVGRLSTDVTLGEFNGRQVANFSIASNTKRKIGEKNGYPEYGVNFYRVSAWGQAADTASKYLKKGQRVGISGDLEIREYTGNDNLKHTAVEINNAEITMIETRTETAAKAETAPQAAPAAQPQYQQPLYQPAPQPLYQQAPAAPQYTPQAQPMVYQANPAAAVPTNQLPF